MSVMVDRFDDRHITAESIQSASLADLVGGHYDYILLGSSWDRRCLSLTSARISADLIQVLVPSNPGSTGLRALHDQSIAKFVQSIGRRIDVVDSASEDLELGFSRIEDAIVGLRKERNRPLRMLVDLSSSARYFTLGAVALGLNDSVAEYVDVTYAEGEYGEIQSRRRVAGGDSPVSSWDAVAVPRLEGDWYPAHRRHFLVSVGFESAKVISLTERWDPDRVSVLFPSPAVAVTYETLTRESNNYWMKQYGVGDSDIIAAPSADAVAAWRVLCEAPALDAIRNNVYCVLCGSKPHSLALALYSLSRERPAVMYVRPAFHEERDISPNGRYWRYRVRDRTMIA